jgi:hypothetical protein
VGKYILFAITCIFVLLQSPLAPCANGVPGVDSGVFIYSAKKIMSGQLMYKDIFDHKGPVLYIIDIIGLKLSPADSYTSIWMLEVLSLFAACIFVYKTGKLLFNKQVSILGVISALFFMIPLLIGGNLTEEWAILNIAIAQYIFAQYFLKKHYFNKTQLFLLTISFLSTFLLKSNMVAIWAAFGIVIGFNLVSEKKYIEIAKYLTLIILYSILCLAPLFIYAIHKNILNEAIFCIFKYNSTRYISDYGEIWRYFEKIILGKYYIPKIVVVSFLALIIQIIYSGFKRTQTDNYLFKISFILTFLLSVFVCSIGMRFEHYFLIFMPIIAIINGYLFQFITKLRSKYFSNSLLIIVFLLINTNNVYTQILKIRDNYNKNIASGLCCPSRTTLDSICTNVNKYIGKDDRFVIYGNLCSVYLFSNQTCPIKYPFVTYFNEDLIKDYISCIIKTKPKLIISGSTVRGTNLELAPKKEEEYWFEKAAISETILNRYKKVPSNIKEVDFWLLKE